MKKTLAIMLALIMVLALVPTVAFAETYVARIGETDYATLGEAVKDAKSGDTIMLGEGEYSLYDVCGHKGAPGSSKDYTAGKDLTFIGKGEKTIWQIGSKIPDPAYDGTEYNGDYSFEGAGTVTFKKMTLRAPLKDSGEGWNYLGFIRADNTVVEDCTMFGKTFFWGYKSATFTKTTFNCPAGDYAVWTYCSPTMSFYNCTFNSTGKVINVYTDYSAGKHDITVNFNNCTVKNTGNSLKPVLNINDSNMCDFKYILNITGDNKVTGVNVDNITCSRLFGFGGKAANNTGRSVVTINGVEVWKKCEQEGTQKGERACAHNGVVFGEGSYNGDKTTQYTDGYKDNAFTVTPKPNVPGSFDVTCDYCGYKETSTGKLYNDIGLTRTVRQNKNSNPVPADDADPNKYKVANSNDITVDYTATMNMENLKWQVAGKDVKEIPGALGNASSPWELLKNLAQQIDGKTEVKLNFKFDDDKIDLGAFQTKYESAGKKADVLKLESTMFEMTDVAFGTDNTMTITCKWKENAKTDNPTITLNGYGLPVKNDWNGSKQININNSGCVSGTVHIQMPKVKITETVPSVAENVQAQNNTPPVDNTIQIPIVGGCKTDEFTLYYGGGSSGDGHSYYYPTTTPVPVIVIPPKTGDMTVWQSILNFLGIK